MSLFIDHNITKVSERKISDYVADFFIDVSGSTSGSILEAEKVSAVKMSAHFKEGRIIAWGDTAVVKSSFSELRSNGGTYPWCFSGYVSKNDNVMIVYTDGQINVSDMERFKKSMIGKLNNSPVIIIFAVPSFDMTLEDLQSRYINMSIPETFLSLSNDVAILITNKQHNHKILMTKGCFNYLEAMTLAKNTFLNSLPNFNFKSLSDISVIGGLPSHMIKLKTMSNYIDLNVLYKQDDLSLEFLEGLCDRTLFPKFDLSLMHAMITKINRKLAENPELDAVRNELFEMSTSPDAGSEKHKQLIAKYNEVKSKKNTVINKSKLVAINKLLENISEYQRDSTSIVFGSNRAMRSTTFNTLELDFLGNCEQVECPILLEKGDGCILLKCPENQNYIEEYTSDYAMEAPFEFGTWLTKLVTPGMYCHEIAKISKINPFTRDKLIGYLPLSDDPGVIMKHMSKLFGGNKELWHFVRGYISMMVYACDCNWVDKNKIIPSIKKLVANYNATIDLKGGSDKVPLETAFKHVLTNYSVCMRDRTRVDNLAIIKIVRTLMPDFNFEEQKIIGMSNTVGTFAELLNKHKQCDNMIKYVMDVDDYGHYVNYKTGLQGLIAQLLWYDVNGEYRLLKLQLAIDKALGDKKFGKELKKSMMGEKFDETILECAFSEPKGDHTGEPLYLQWTKEGLPELQCIYCGQHFCDTQSKLQHLKLKFGNHFYNGHLACKHAVQELGVNASEKELFKCAKERLYKWYGDKNKALHTKRCKNRLLFFINKFKEDAQNKLCTI